MPCLRHGSATDAPSVLLYDRAGCCHVGSAGSICGLVANVCTLSCSYCFATVSTCGDCAAFFFQWSAYISFFVMRARKNLRRAWNLPTRSSLSDNITYSGQDTMRNFLAIAVVLAFVGTGAIAQTKILRPRMGRKIVQSTARIPRTAR